MFENRPAWNIATEPLKEGSQKLHEYPEINWTLECHHWTLRVSLSLESGQKCKATIWSDLSKIHCVRSLIIPLGHLLHKEVPKCQCGDTATSIFLKHQSHAKVSGCCEKGTLTPLAATCCSWYNLNCIASPCHPSHVSQLCICKARQASIEACSNRTTEII